MKDYRKTIRQKTADNIADFFTEKGYGVEVFEGTLLDNYLIDAGDCKYRIGRVKGRRYIIIHVKRINEWCSELEMILTDNQSLYDEYMRSFEAMNVA